MDQQTVRDAQYDTLRDAQLRGIGPMDLYRDRALNQSESAQVYALNVPSKSTAGSFYKFTAFFARHSENDYGLLALIMAIGLSIVCFAVVNTLDNQALKIDQLHRAISELQTKAR